MPALIPRPPLTPECVACCRRFARLSLASPNVAQMQVRGKKKNPKARAHVDVKLVKDLPGYGRKGAIVPVAIGRMRNIYFPQRIAEYVSMAQAKDLRRNNVAIERDFNFGKETADEIVEIKAPATTLLAQPPRPTRSPEPASVSKVDLELLEPEVAFAALAATIPPFVNFYRAPITTADSPKEGSTTQVAGSTTNLYGSVSTADVATSLKALLASSGVAGNIVLADDDIRFVGSGGEEEDFNRVKQLGTFDIEIKVKGYGEALRRQVRVLPEDAVRNEQNEDKQRINDMAPETPIASEPSPAMLKAEAQVAELEALVQEAMRDRTNPISNGQVTHRQERGSEGSPEANNERV